MNEVFIFKGECDPYAFIKEKADEKYNNTEIVKTEKGKPFFKDIPNLFFSISHKDEVTVVVLGDSEVGVDVERIKKPDFRILKRFLPQEADYINQTDSTRRFFEIWTKKEAYLKFKGTGISGGLKNVNVLELSFETLDFEDYIISIYSE